MNRFALLFTVALAVVVCSADQPSAAAGAVAADQPSAAAGPVADASADAGKAVGAAGDVDESGKFFLFAQRSTTTSFAISTSELEVLSTCFQAFSATACAGRRKRRFVKLERSVPFVDGDENLDSSLSGSIAGDSEDAPKKSSKYFFTVWDTSVSTLVVVSTTINDVNIVSVSAACQIAGDTYDGCK